MGTGQHRDGWSGGPPGRRALSARRPARGCVSDVRSGRPRSPSAAFAPRIFCQRGQCVVQHHFGGCFPRFFFGGGQVWEPPRSPPLPPRRPSGEDETTRRIWKTCWGLRAAPAAAVCRSAAARAPARLRPPPLSALRGTCLRAVLAVAAIARVRRLKEQQGLAAPNPTRAMTAGSTMLTRVVACPQARATSCPPREPARRAMPQSPPRPDEDGRLTASS